jgi:hypothetical protein
MAEWMTGVMMMDMIAIEVFMNAMDTMNSPTDTGVAVVTMPTETAAATQVEILAPPTTGVIGYIYAHPSGRGGGGGIYPV